MESKKGRISKRSVNALEPPAKGESRLWDTEVRGFFVRAYPSGRMTYALKYRTVHSVQAVLTLGTHGSPETPETARAKAIDALRRVANSENPAEAKQELKSAISVASLIDLYLSKGPITNLMKRQSSWESDASCLNSHIRPQLGPRIAESLSEADALGAVHGIIEGRTAKTVPSGKARGMTRISGGIGAARRTAAVAAAMFSWARLHGHVQKNPFSGIKLPAAPQRESYLSKIKLAKFIDALSELEHEREVSENFADAIRLILLTGARKTEILGLRWDEVNFDQGFLLLPAERTKAGGVSGRRLINLSPPALELLSVRSGLRETDLPDEGEQSPFVFRAYRGGGHAVGLRRPFLKVCARAGLEGLTVHDLRHTFASLAVAGGASLFLVSKLLGHANSRSSERYSHLSNDPLQDATNLVGNEILNLSRKGAGDAGNIRKLRG